MDFKELTYVLAIARHQNITRAAEALHLTQPTLSKFLKALETELHQPLFQRLGNRYQPTYAGERYLQRPGRSWRPNGPWTRKWATSSRTTKGT